MSLESLLTTGVPQDEDLQRATPPASRRQKGPFVVIECFQEIPCDPCYHACRFGAIEKFENINHVPRVNWNKCTGCGACISACPGLAIFVVDETISETECLIGMPHEFVPVPEKGRRVTLLRRDGTTAGTGTVERVIPGRKPSGTTVIWVRAPKELSMVVRNIRLDQNPTPDDWETVDDPDLPDDTIVCRCEDVTLGEIRRVIREGATTLDEVKRVTRAGMGPCQGRTCRLLILGELARAQNVTVDEIRQSRYRPPIKPVKLGDLAPKKGEEER